MPAQAAEAGCPPRSSARALDLDQYIPAQITDLAQKLSSAASALYRPAFGVGVTDWRIMAMLAGSPWVHAGRICDATGLDKAAVSRGVRGLERGGLVDVRRDPADPRRQSIALTPHGLVVHDLMVEMARAREAGLLQGFSAAERHLLTQFLRRLAAQLHAAS